jgi:hypothetical protein
MDQIEEKKQAVENIAWARVLRAVSHLKDFNVITPIITALLGAFGFWLSPLKDKVYFYLYPPKAIFDYEILSVHHPVMRGDTFMVRLHLVPGNSNLTSGEIRANIPEANVTLEEGNQLVDLDGTEKAKVIQYTFAAIKAGGAHLQYVYTFARGGAVQKDIDFVIVDRKDGFPTFGDLTGEWGLMWEQGLGTLKIIQQNARISGVFSLTEADSRREITGNITGFVNGYNMRLILSPDKARSTEKALSKALYVNLLRVSGPHELSICGRLNPAKDEPFLGQVVDPNAPVSEICKGANILARAQLD